MWTEEQRRIYRREGDGYPSDLRDVEWARLAPLIPPALPGGRPRKTDMRAAMNAILFLLRTGCQRLAGGRCGGKGWRRCAWRSSCGATIRRALSSYRAAGWS